MSADSEDTHSFDIIIIGGGAAGCSTAMHLAERGQRVLVLEKGMLGSGSTGKAAGLGGQLRTSADETNLLMEGLKSVLELERRLGTQLFVRTGSLHVAATPARAAEICNFVKMGKEIGFEIDHVNRNRAEKLLPCMKSDDLIEFCYCPTDGHFQPAELLAAYVQVAREAGAKFMTDKLVDSIEISNGATQGVWARGQLYSAPTVVNAAGPWSHLLADIADVQMPTAAIGHCYLVTHPLAEVPIGPTDAAIRDRENRIYSRAEVGGLLVGTYDAEPSLYDMNVLGAEFEMTPMKAAHDSLQVAVLIDAASRRFPFISNRTPMKVTTGIMTFTPDGHALCGPVRNVDGLFHCTGFNGRGVFQSAASGRIMAELILDGRCQHPVDHLRADRMNDYSGLGDRDAINGACYARYASHYGSDSRTVDDTIEAKSDEAT